MNYTIPMDLNCEVIPTIEKPSKTTTFERITRDDDKVKITLHALSSRKFSSLERTALKYFAEWQLSNYSKLGYKSSEIVEHQSEPDTTNNTHFYYSLIINLIF